VLQALPCVRITAGISQNPVGPRNGRLPWGRSHMKAVTVTAAIWVLALTSCSEGPAIREMEQASGLLGQASARFAVLPPILKTTEVIEKDGERFFFRAPDRTPSVRGSWRPSGQHVMAAEFPGRAGGATRITNGPVTLWIRPLGVGDVPGALTELQDAVVYEGSRSGADSFVVASRDLVEEFILLRDHRTPRQFEYDLKVIQDGGRLRLQDGVVEVLDSSGEAWLRLEPPFLVDGAGKRHHVAVKLESGRLVLTLPEEHLTYPVLLDPGWTSTGNMAKRRFNHSAVLLTSGKVLVMGNSTGSSTVSKSAELYDPKTGTWTTTGSMSKGRDRPHAFVLPSGKVIAIGSHGKSNTDSAEVYDPVKQIWANTGSLVQDRTLYSATLLSTGKILVAGGRDPATSYMGPRLKSAELYNSASGTWSSTGSMKYARGDHSAALLKSGKVLVVGGTGWMGTVPVPVTEIYDPAKGTWSDSGKLLEELPSCHSVTLNSGHVLAIPHGNLGYSSKTQLYTPTSGLWAYSASHQFPSGGFSATLIKSGMVLLTGGNSLAGYSSNSALYSPTTGLWASSANLINGRIGHTATRLNSGAVLLAGGDDYNPYNFSTSELYDPTSGLACMTSTDCATGTCVDGICCAAVCTETCRKCVAITSTNGTYGKCTGYVTAGQPDLDATKPCKGTGLCDGKGTCKKGNGQVCASGKDCGSGYCVDGVCCASSCTTPCFSCNLQGKAGICSPLAINTTDSKAKPPCTGKDACDGAGACKSALGQACTNNQSCSSGICMDGRCCDKACLGTCRSCNISGKEGYCSPVSGARDSGCDDVCVSCAAGICTALSLGATVTSGAKTCSKGSVCDGQGNCKSALGKACTYNASCASGICMDGRCCDKACLSTCYSCNVTGKEGTCSALTGDRDTGCDDACVKCAVGKCTALPPGATVTSGAKICSGNSSCDGSGNCKKVNSKTCSKGLDCTSDQCWDGRCCDVACDKTCRSCKLSQKEGTCSFIPQGKDPDNDCIGKHPLCGGACDGKGACEFPGLGTNCGKCQACDGTGNCTKTPTDDINCGTIDCDKLDTACRDYHDLTTARCDSFGACKKPNLATTCVKFTDLCGGDVGIRDQGSRDSGRDAGPGKPDQASVPPASNEDDGCAVGGSKSTDGEAIPLTLTLLLIVLLLPSWTTRRGLTRR